MYTIQYEYDPNEALDICHRANAVKCTAVDSKTFADKMQAIRFWYECTCPVTHLESIIEITEEIKILFNQNSAHPVTDFEESLVKDKILYSAIESTDSLIAGMDEIEE
jgi:hypothetical protein